MVSTVVGYNIGEDSHTRQYGILMYLDNGKRVFMSPIPPHILYALSIVQQPLEIKNLQDEFQCLVELARRGDLFYGPNSIEIELFYRNLNCSANNTYEAKFSTSSNEKPINVIYCPFSKSSGSRAYIKLKDRKIIIMDDLRAALLLSEIYGVPINVIDGGKKFPVTEIKRWSEDFCEGMKHSAKLYAESYPYLLIIGHLRPYQHSFLENNIPNDFGEFNLFQFIHHIVSRREIFGTHPEIEKFTILYNKTTRKARGVMPVNELEHRLLVPDGFLLAQLLNIEVQFDTEPT